MVRLPPVARDATKPLEVLRWMPEGEVPLAPELSVTFSQPMVAVTSQEDAAKTTPVKLTPQPKGNWRWIGTRTILIILYIAINLPLAIWMTRSFFVEVPRELIEAAEIDGTSLINQLRSVILPIAAPGIAATALLCVIFAWNEYFYAIQLNFAGASTMPQWVIGNVSTRGNFLAKLSAASIIACLPVVLAGWAAQKRMIRGLSMGAIK